MDLREVARAHQPHQEDPRLVDEDFASLREKLDRKLTAFSGGAIAIVLVLVAAAASGLSRVSAGTMVTIHTVRISVGRRMPRSEQLRSGAETRGREATDPRFYTGRRRHHSTNPAACSHTESWRGPVKEAPNPCHAGSSR